MGRVRTHGLKALLGTGFVALLVLLIPASALAFDDVPPGHQYFGAISDLSGRGIISGFTATTFGPGEPVTRQQFAKMIVLTLDIPVSESLTSPFKDVAHKPGELYPYYYVAAAANRGITTGVTATLFKPYDNITRAQVITMVVRAVDALYPGTLKSPEPGFVASWGNFSAQHAANAATAEANGLLAGLAPTGTALSSLNPLGFMPRGEVAQVLHNLLELLGDAIAPPVEPPLPPVNPPVKKESRVLRNKIQSPTNRAADMRK